MSGQVVRAPVGPGHGHRHDFLVPPGNHAGHQRLTQQYPTRDQQFRRRREHHDRRADAAELLVDLGVHVGDRSGGVRRADGCDVPEDHDFTGTRVSSSSTDHWSYTWVPWWLDSTRPSGAMRKSAGKPNRPPSGFGGGAGFRLRTTSGSATATARTIHGHAFGCSSDLGADSTPNSRYRTLSGSATTSNGRSATCGRRSSTREWNRTTSCTPAAATSLCRATNERRCRLHTGQPANRRNCRCTRRSGSGRRTGAPWTVDSSRARTCSMTEAPHGRRTTYIYEYPRIAYAVNSCPDLAR